MSGILPPNHFIVFDGQNLADWGVHISGDNTFGAPERDVDEIEIPGRDGSISFDNGRFKNIDITYDGSLLGEDPEDYLIKLQQVRSFLCSRKGYKRLEDSYRVDEFRLAKFVDGLDPDGVMLTGSTFDLKFNCKPQRFLKSGEEILTMTSTGSVFNFTNFTAKPLIRVWGSGTFSVGNNKVTITKPSTVEYVDIDSDMQDCYSDSQNCNGDVVLNNVEFPVFEPGENIVTIETGITKIEITPRWYIV